MSVLVLSNRADETADYLCRRMEQCGVTYARLRGESAHRVQQAQQAPPARRALRGRRAPRGQRVLVAQQDLTASQRLESRSHTLSNEVR